MPIYDVGDVALVSTPSSGDSGTYLCNGQGSLFTAMAIGTVGQTATVSGTNDTTKAVWRTIATLTVDANGSDSAVWQATWRYIKVEGAAQVHLSRGVA